MDGSSQGSVCPFYIDTRRIEPYARRIPDTRTLPFSERRVYLPWCARPGRRKMGKVPVKLDGTIGGHTNAAVLVRAIDAAQWALNHSTVALEDGTWPIAGIMLILLPGSPICGVDLDGCRDRETGRIADWAAEIVEATKDLLYWEVSPGLEGLRGFGLGAWNATRTTLKRADGSAIELYDGGHGARALTVTGLHLPGTASAPAAEADPQRLADLAAQWLPPATAVESLEIGPCPTFRSIDIETLGLDEHLIGRIREGAPEGQRSEAVFHVAVDLLRRGVSREDTACILADPQYRISEAALERRGTLHGAVRWIWKYSVQRAAERLLSEAQAFGEVETTDADEGAGESLRLPTWRELERARSRQALQNLTGGLDRDVVPYASVRAAFSDPSVTLVISPPASGKSRETIALARQYLERDNPEELLIIFTASYALMTEIAGPLAAMLGEERAGQIAYVTQNDPLQPFVDGQSDHRPYRVVVCSHATALPRGHDISSVGRVLLKAMNARDAVERHGLQPLRITIVADEVDVLLQQLGVQIQIGLREVETTDSVMETPVRRAVGSHCPGNCPECRALLEFATHARGMKQGKGLVLGLRPKYPLPSAGERQRLDLDWLRPALKPATLVKGYADQEVDAGLLPTEDEIPLFHVVPAAQGVGLRTRPNPAGIIRELASRPGASVRYGVVRDAGTGELIDPADVTADREVVYPRNSCVPYLMSWNPRPLAEMRAVADRLILTSATIGKTSMAMIEETLGAVKVARVTIPPERKMKEVLLVGVSRWTLESASVGALVSVAPLLILHRYAEEAREHADRIAGWRGQHGILPATWARRGAECDVQGRFNLLSAPIRSAIGRGVNLPFFRLLLTWANCYISAKNAFALGHASLHDAVESERMDTLIQGITRIMRWDADALKEGRPPDDGRRAVIVVTGEDDEHNLSGVFMDNLASRLTNNTEQLTVLNFQTFPSRAGQAVIEWMTAGAVSVDDKPIGGSRNLSRRQRERTKPDREAQKAAQRESKREALRADKRAKAEAMLLEGTPWRTIARTLNLSRHFSEEELKSIKNQ